MAAYQSLIKRLRLAPLGSPLHLGWMGVVFLLCTVIGLTARPQGWGKLLADSHNFYDAANYIRIALKGYEDPTLTAFYPIWPLILRSFGKVLSLESPYHYGLLGIGLATALFGVSVYILSLCLKNIGDSSASKFALWFYVLAPVSVFHIIGYTESLAAVLIALLCFSLQMRHARPWIFVLTFLLCLTRPLSYFIGPAAIFSWLGVWIADSQHSKGELSFRSKQMSAIVSGTITAHLAYMYIQWRAVGDPFATTKAQNTWGRELGLHWELITNPKVVGGSDNVLHLDMLAFYGPAIFLLFALYKRWIPVQHAFVFWFMGLIPLGLAGVQFLTYDLYASLARHIFALPFITIIFAIGLQGRLHSLRWQRIFLTVWAIFLIRWWVRFGEGAWIG